MPIVVRPAAWRRTFDGGHVDVGRQVLAADVPVRIVVDLVADVGAQRAIASANRVVQLGGGGAVVDEQQHAPREIRGDAARSRPSSARAELGGLAVDELDAGVGQVGRDGLGRAGSTSTSDEPAVRAEVDGDLAQQPAASADPMDRQGVEDLVAEDDADEGPGRRRPVAVAVARRPPSRAANASRRRGSTSTGS